MLAVANTGLFNGFSERGGHPVEKKKLRQWYLRITEYADRLLSGLETIQFSEAMKEMQSNWIGKSFGAEIDFKIQGTEHSLKVYTTRPDTLYGATFMVIAPEHPLLVRKHDQIKNMSDIHTYQGKRVEKSPTILGHEIVGVIEQLGPNAPVKDVRGNELKIGDKVTWAIFASSPEDDLSKAGIPQKAKDLFKYGHEQITDHSHFHGGLSANTVLRKNTPIAMLNNDLPNEIASLINCSVATVAGAIRLAGELKSKTVLVYGAGMLGVIACAMASKMGAINIIAIDENEQRLEISKKFNSNFFL